MKLEIKVMSALCSLSIFNINGIEADYDDFGNKYDSSPDTADDYCCGNMEFFICEAQKEILDKYKINTDEYYEIAHRLKELLSFGSCCWCS